ncbi:MAG: NUDIX hydrolase [Verrucomicrobia bacterium]|nr:NUDIX hydrolase [Verrucomicrobiota bacterium]
MSMARESAELSAWATLDRRAVYEAPPFVRLSVERVRLPDGRVIEDYHRIVKPDYALVVPQRADGRILLVRQYKHGVGAVGLYPPGGYVAPGESPLQAAQRELLEETGHVAGRWRSLGAYTADANHGCGRAHFFAAEELRCADTPRSGDLEAMELVFLTPQGLLEAMTRGEINALGAATGLALALLPGFSISPENR